MLSVDNASTQNRYEEYRSERKRAKKEADDKQRSMNVILIDSCNEMEKKPKKIRSFKLCRELLLESW